MNRKIQRLLALILAAVLAGSLCLPALEAKAAEQIRIVVDGTVYEAPATLGSDGQWQVSPWVLAKTTGLTAWGKQVSLAQAAKDAGWSYEHDGVLRAAYIWTQGDAYNDYGLGLKLPYLPQEAAKLDPDGPISAALFRKMLAALIQAVAPEKMSYFDAKVKVADFSIQRGEASLMAWYAAQCIGADDHNFKEFQTSLTEGTDFWAMEDIRFDQMFTDWAKGPIVVHGETWNNEFIAGYLWNLWHKSPKTGLQVIAYDYDAMSIRNHDLLTARDAISALARLAHSVKGADHNYISITSAAARNPDSGVLTKELLAQAGKTGIRSLDQLPQLTGFVLTTNTEGYYESREITTTAEELKQISQWGFSGSRFMVSYQTFFNEDCTQVDEVQLERLDELVAAAIRYDLHLNLLLLTLPGRWSAYDPDTFQSQADLDLFVQGNQEDLEKSKAIWSLLAQRYRDVPGAYLSFTPFWEALNKNLSTGLPDPNYGPQDVLRVLRELTDTIRAEDPDRFLIYEPTANNPTSIILEEATQAYQTMSREYDNVRISYNFCENPYVYAEMTATQGEHIDHNNHGMFKPDYPVTIYGLNEWIGNGHDLTLDGFLPEGTQITVHVAQANSGSRLRIRSGSTVLAEENVGGTHTTGTLLSGFYPYAESEKTVTVTVPAGAEAITLSAASGGIRWSGIQVDFPQEYAVEKWYFPSRYDMVSAGLEFTGPYRTKTAQILLSPYWNENAYKATLKQDMIYTTEKVYAQSNAQTIAHWSETMSQLSPKATVRFENAYFSVGTTQASAIRYYNDLLDSLNEVGFDWLSNDFSFILNGSYAGASTVRYGHYGSFDKELLETFQNHQQDVTVVTDDGPQQGFADVAPGSYCYDAVNWAVEQEVTTGTSEITFSPEATCTRGQVATFLWRAMGRPGAGTNSGFQDVAESVYYAEPITWAVDKEITNGTSATTFNPNGLCNVEHILTFLWRAMGKPEPETILSFPDADPAAYYARAISWAVEQGIAEANAGGAIGIGKPCPRGWTVTYLYRCLAK